MVAERDILDEFERQRRAPPAPDLPATNGLVVEDRATRFCGAVVGCDAQAVTLRDGHGNRREFRLKPAGFVHDGKPVTLVRPRPKASAVEARSRVTNSGSVAAPRSAPAKLARASRIWVEGRHDAELVEHVWGDDLRELGIVVEPMHGIDDLAGLVREFAPGSSRRLGILVDHLVAGSKESRLAATIRDPHVLITGHPFVDVWAGVWPRVLGRSAWPDVPRGVPWKEGMCAALGTDPRTFWPTLRNRVNSYVDLRPELVGAVERLIDFVGDAG
jgi:hypothetical protein